jgi:hypothetical protein
LDCLLEHRRFEEFTVDLGTAQAKNVPSIQMGEDTIAVAAVNMYEISFLLAASGDSYPFNEQSEPEDFAAGLGLFFDLNDGEELRIRWHMDTLSWHCREATIGWIMTRGIELCNKWQCMSSAGAYLEHELDPNVDDSVYCRTVATSTTNPEAGSEFMLDRDKARISLMNLSLGSAYSSNPIT